MDLDKKITSITVNGKVDMTRNQVSINEFVDMFLDWMASNKWYFSGTSCDYNNENICVKIKPYQIKKRFSKLSNKEKYKLHKQAYEKLSKLEKGDYIEGLKFFEDI